jgi:hypothetical protein
LESNTLKKLSKFKDDEEMKLSGERAN